MLKNLQNNNFKNYWAKIYSRNNAFGIGPTKLAKTAVNIINTHKIKKILELGCGQGRDALFFSKCGYEVVAVDISEEAINFVKEQKKKLGLKNLEVFPHDIKTPLNHNEYFDFVYSNLALQFFDLDELEIILKNISKTMKENSLFMLSTKKKGDKYFNFGNKISEYAYEYKGITRYFFDKSVLHGLLSKQFKVIKFDSNNHVNLDSSVSVWWSIVVKKK